MSNTTWIQSNQVERARIGFHKSIRVETLTGSWIANLNIFESAVSFEKFSGILTFYRNAAPWSSRPEIEINTILHHTIEEAQADIEALFEMCVAHIRSKAEKAVL